jgi:serine/threonine protein kinase
MKMDIPDTIETNAKRKFIVGKKLYDGDLAEIYSATYANGAGDSNVLLKVVRDKRDNDLLENEVSVLNFLYPPRQKDEKFFRYLPKLVDTTRLGDRRQVTILPHFEEYVSLAEIIAAYPKGIDFRDMVWMYKRLLAGLGFIHEMGVIHGAILPTHVLVHPTAHGAKIIDWSYALNFAALASKASAPPVVDPVPDPAATMCCHGTVGCKGRGDKHWCSPVGTATSTAAAPATKKIGVWDLLRQNLYADDDPPPVVVAGGPPPDPNAMYVKAVSVDHKSFYAPEIFRKESPRPATDIYHAAKCAVALLGGDVETNQVPDTVPTQVRAFLQASLLPNPHKRPQDAWQVHEDFDRLLVSLVGKPTYRPFYMPAKGGTS